MGSGSSKAVALRQRAGRKRAERDASHAAQLAALEEKGSQPPAAVALRILTSTATQLAAALAAGDVTSEQIVRVFALRCATVGMSMAAVTEENYTNALEAARASDARRAAGNALGPLDGIPISVKDQIDQAGFDSTCGNACRTFRPAAQDAVVIAVLRRAGAIPFVRSNVPQCLMLPESCNIIWGACTNPFNAARTPGGSSGGEGALIGAHCSPLGIGTDIGGSIRIPAHFCGVYGFKPTPQRVSHVGIPAPRPRSVTGQNAILPAVGPLGCCPDDLALVMRTWLQPSMFEADPFTPPTVFNEAAFRQARRLRIGIMHNDRFFEPSPSCSRAVHEAADALRAAGHDVIDWDPNTRGVDTYQAALLYFKILAADGKLDGFIQGLEGEDLQPIYFTLQKLANIPNWARPAIATVLRWLGKPRLADLCLAAKAKSARELWRCQEDLLLLQHAFAQAWAADRLDLLVCPGLGLPALPHGFSQDCNVAASYTFLFNTLNFPAGTVPVTFVRDDECVYTPPAYQRDDFAAKAAESLRGAAGLPVGVQVVGLPYADELVLCGMNALAGALASARGAVPVPHTYVPEHVNAGAGAASGAGAGAGAGAGVEAVLPVLQSRYTWGVPFDALTVPLH